MLKAISSMATRQVLGELAAAHQGRAGQPIAIESVGGVDAARRVQEGEAFDAVFLASDAIDKLIASGRIAQGSKVDLFLSPVVVAVRKGAALPDIGSEVALRRAVLAAESIGYSTGPSGVALTKLFERWGIGGDIAGRIVQAPPGVPVGSLVADGKCALGFQQLSELMNLEGIAIVGSLPEAVQIVTTFSAGICAASSQVEAAQRMLDFMASPEATEAKRRNGMEPA
ncbi:MAG: substrate-binding domain-containing protein [Ramlibacter sp.]